MTEPAAPPETPPSSAPADEGAAAWEQLAERAAEAEPAAEPSPDQDAAGQGELAPLDWGFAAAGLVGAFAVYANNWALTHEEQSKLASHLSAALAACFPDVRMDARWQAAGAFLMVAGGIAMTRRDPAGGLLPLRKPKAEAPAGQGAGGADAGGLVLKPSAT